MLEDLIEVEEEDVSTEGSSQGTDDPSEWEK